MKAFKLKNILTATCLISLYGCGTLNFVNGLEVNDTVKREQWHHSGIFEFIEFSSPIKINYLCDNKQWDSITIEKSFSNLIASSAYVYTPWIAYYECRENIDY